MKIGLEDVEAWLDTLEDGDYDAYLEPLYDWSLHARPEQLEPDGDWSVWIIMAGRGFGKTRSGGEWVRHVVKTEQCRRLALVARTRGDARDVMIEGESGVLAISPPGERPQYQPSVRRLTWPRPEAGVAPAGQIAVGAESAVATIFTAEEPELLRGPEHDGAWVDELAAWKYVDAWSNLLLTLRAGENPRVVATTTPRPRKFLRDLLAEPTTVVTRGSTYDNIANLAPAFRTQIISRYEGTSLGRQELYAELLEEADGAIWKRADIDAHRLRPIGWDTNPTTGLKTPLYDLPKLAVIAVAIDPAMSAEDGSNETGIVVVGRANLRENGSAVSHFYVLDDGSGRYRPLEWAAKAIYLYHEYEADAIIGEKNNGGDMIGTVIETVEKDLPYELVWASRGKRPRAEPVAALYEQGRGHHVGGFDDLEDQMCNWEPGQGEDSPDRMDALVWAIRHLMDSDELGAFPLTKLRGLVGADRTTEYHSI
jgi:phage terminase large subunit-like protein